MNIMVRGKAACIFARPKQRRFDRVRRDVRKYRYAEYEELEDGEDDEKKRTIKLVLKRGCFAVRVLYYKLSYEVKFADGR